MDNNERNPFDSRPRPENEESASARESAGAGNGEEAAGREDRASHYFSYGPYKSNIGSTMSSDGTGHTPVEVTPPKPLRSYAFSPQEEGADRPMGSWQVGQPQKKGAGFRSIFAAFMAGVLVVGSLMVASDRMNLFTGPQGVMTGSGTGSSQLAAPAAGNGGVVPTALGGVVRPDNISSIVQQAGPAVVKIETLVKPKATQRSNSLFNDPFFRQFFGEDAVPQQPDSGSSGQLQPGGMGTGFIFEKSGYILTNEHVIEGADEINVYVKGREEPYKAKLLGNSYDLDLAALKIEGDTDFPTLPIGSTDSVNEGDWVVAIGNPYGFDHTVTVGVLSAKERPIDIPDSNGTRHYKHLLQTDASINPGNSGGPLLNLNGEVIGINTAVSAQAQGIGFAIPTSTISSVLDNLKNNVEIPKEPVPYIGVALDEIDKDWVAELQLENTEGSIVTQVERKSPAFQAGIRPYDVIVEVNGTKVKNTKETQEAIKKLKAGDKVTIGIMREGKKVPVSVTIGDRNVLLQQQQQQ
ncbi:S1C family serine protease [Paenibacillus mucilaginosus]|uniref:HtrA2 peptidase n=1 Tax=Paenibacillus mucilaginosus (strain KNP414) TaxID=1036673 RepID=F8FCF4_PAEMK|nr:trypsin-like peptidase domain-containing protein [Paenibacillus mucilaginosus]AEI45273.1 HtrA2 peptidase [Paenibacillus mucilaginosus KNP414]MCG7212840.1 trypsin-like peptidase domain-containing protein [Paenibacillus mucilaginosus]WDM26738.1 trypsin-like peptidase domain-containing protein [Paenibacillus mucilaginosus]